MTNRISDRERDRSDRFTWQEGDVEVHHPSRRTEKNRSRRHRVHDREDGDPQGDDPREPRAAS